MARGVDVIYQNADAAGLGIFRATKDSKNVYIIGSNANQNSVAPGVTLGSVVIDLRTPHYRGARGEERLVCAARHRARHRERRDEVGGESHHGVDHSGTTLHLVDSLARAMADGTFNGAVLATFPGGK